MLEHKTLVILGNQSTLLYKTRFPQTSLSGVVFIYDVLWMLACTFFLCSINCHRRISDKINVHSDAVSLYHSMGKSLVFSRMVWYVAKEKDKTNGQLNVLYLIMKREWFSTALATMVLVMYFTWDTSGSIKLMAACGRRGYMLSLEWAIAQNMSVYCLASSTHSSCEFLARSPQCNWWGLALAETWVYHIRQGAHVSYELN